MDIGLAFSYMFNDSDWIKKLAIGGALILGGTILLPFFFIGIVLYIPVIGYTLRVLQNVRDGREQPLPEWDFGDMFGLGGKAFVVWLIYMIVPFLLSCASAVPQIGMDLVDDPDMVTLLAVVLVCLNCVQFIVSLLFQSVFGIALIKFAETEQIGAAFKFGEIFGFIRDNIADFVIVYVLYMVSGILAMFGGLILCFIGIFFTIFWSYLVHANLYGQLARKMPANATVSY